MKRNNFYTDSKDRYLNWKRVRKGLWKNFHTGDVISYGKYYDSFSWMLVFEYYVLDAGSFSYLTNKYNNYSFDEVEEMNYRRYGGI